LNYAFCGPEVTVADYFYLHQFIWIPYLVNGYQDPGSWFCYVHPDHWTSSSELRFGFVNRHRASNNNLPRLTHYNTEKCNTGKRWIIFLATKKINIYTDI
jgi:hypothetical protein